MGHYCRICGRVHPNEKFTGRGHRDHLCKDCQRMPREERDRIERVYELEGFLHQSRISEKNLKRIQALVEDADAEVAGLAALMHDIGQAFPSKKNRWLNMARLKPELFERALGVLGLEFFEDLLSGYGNFESPLWSILERYKNAPPQATPRALDHCLLVKVNASIPSSVGARCL